MQGHQIYDNGVTHPDSEPQRRRRWPWIAAGSLGAVAAGSAAAMLMLTPAHGPTPACQHATVTQNQFVEEAVAQGYPYVDIATGMAIQEQDLKLMDNMRKAGCSPDTLIEVLPDS